MVWHIEPEPPAVDDDVQCHWPIVGCCQPGATMNPESVAIGEQAAADILWVASGRQFGTCQVTIRPCGPRCLPGWPFIDAWDLVSNPGIPSVGGSLWWGMTACGCDRDPCSCTRTETLRLWHSNVNAVTEVVIDGVTLDPANYRLARDRRGWKLLRLDGEAWPACQDDNVANGELGSWSISYRFGIPVPAAGQLATGELACEIAKAICGDDQCALPARVRSISRAGAQIAFVDPMDFLADGRTGLYLVDLWINTVNPNRLQRRPRFFRADDPRRRARR